MIYNRMHADGRYAGRQLISEVQFCLNTMPSTNRFSAYQLAFGSNPADNFGWGDEDEDLFAQDTSLSGQFVAQWKLRMMAQEAALREIANSKLRRILAFNNSFGSADVRVGGEVLFYKALSGKALQGPAGDESRASLFFRGGLFVVRGGSSLRT